MKQVKGKQNVAPIRQALDSIGTKVLSTAASTRHLVEKRFGPKPFDTMDAAVNNFRRKLAPVASQFHEWCQAAPGSDTIRRKRRPAKAEGPTE